MVNRATGNEGADTLVSEKVVYAAIPAAAATATRIDAARRICEAGGTATAVTASPSRSMMNRAVERSATRRRRSLSRHPRSRATRAGDTFAGNAVQSGSPRSTAASVSEMSSPSNARLSRHHLEEHAPEGPDVTALIRRTTLGLFGAHVRRRAQNHAHPGHHRRRGDGRRRRGVCASGGHRFEGLRQAEVQHLHDAIGPHFHVGGFQIAMNDALLVRRFDRLGDLLRDRQRVVERESVPARCDPPASAPRPAP